MTKRTSPKKRGPTYREGLLRAAQIADLFADENLRMAHDTILADPIINENRRSAIRNESEREAAIRLSEKLTIDGCIYSSRAHAAQDIAANIRAEIEDFE